MVATPGKERPYGWCVMNYNIVEANMNTRRRQLLKALDGTGCIPLCITSFPRSTHMHPVITRSLTISIIPFYFNFRLGCPGFTNPSHNPTPSGGASNSLFFPDEAIWSGHPRYKYYQLVSYSTYLCLTLFVQNSDKKHPTEEGWKSGYKYSKLVETFLW